MIGNRRLGFVAAAATLLAAAPLSAVFDQWTWLVQCVITVGLMAGAAALIRSTPAPTWASPLGMLLVLIVALTWMFPSGGELIGLLPTMDTVARFAELAAGSLTDMRTYGVPVQDTDPLLFLTVVGVGVVAVVVDLLTVVVRRPALAGLPMLAVYSVPVAVYADSVPPLPFVVGAAGFLWLLVADNIERVRRFGRRFTGDGRDVDIWEPSPLAAAGRRLAVVGVVVAVLLPLTVPGMTTGLLDTFTTAGQAGDGTGSGRSSGQVDLFAALSGQLNLSEVNDMIRVRTDEPEPFYLRFGVADDLRPDGFRVRAPKGGAARGELPDPRDRDGAGSDDVTRRTYRATVEVLDFRMFLMPVFAEPVRVEDLSSRWFYDPDLQVLFSRREQARGRTYSFEYVRSTYQPKALRGITRLSAGDPIRQRYTATPSVPEVEQLVDRLTRGKRTDYDRVWAIYTYFSQDNGFRYSTNTKGGTSGADIVNFLDNKVGFCQQYAAAMAWLVRAAGVPARVAFGFTNGSSREGNTYTLTNRNLHAWTEVYFDGAGWVPFDATPAAAVAGSTRTAWAPDIDAPDPVTPSATASAAPGVDPSTAPGSERDKEEADAGVDLSAKTRAAAPTWPWWAAGGVLLLLAVLALPALRRSLLRRRRTPGPARRPGGAAGPGPADPGGATMVVGDRRERDRAEAHAAWDELLDTLVDLRLPVDPTETPRATAERLVTGQLAGTGSAGEPAGDGVAPTPAAAIALLGQAEERARYAREPLPAEPLGSALQSARVALAAGVSRRVRLTAAVLPPSVLLRWRRSVGVRTSRLVALAGHGRARAMRWNPRRLLANRLAR